MAAPERSWVPFAERLPEALRRASLDTLQVNVGKLCNQACKHCHVEASPTRSEVMSPETAAQVLALADRLAVSTVDITGGAPELCPSFRTLVRESRAAGRHVIDRCNLTVLLERDQEDTAEFLATHQVQVIASLPCYLGENVDGQRGGGVFARSIQALRRLNDLGYGAGEGRVLDLVYNPVGPTLPPEQGDLEAEYKRQLYSRYGIVFDSLYTITNMPVGRWTDQLRRFGQYQPYMHVLAEAFNSAAVPGVMCRSLVSVSWDGLLYDCDFNQMLDMCLRDHERPLTVAEDLLGRRILTADHCYGCTAGAGSSCGGILV